MKFLCDWLFCTVFFLLKFSTDAYNVSVECSAIWHWLYLYVNKVEILKSLIGKRTYKKKRMQ